MLLIGGSKCGANALQVAHIVRGAYGELIYEGVFGWTSYTLLTVSLLPT